jgi:hypothetical protein
MVRASGTDMPMPAARRLVCTSGSERPIIFNSVTPLVSYVYPYVVHYEFIDPGEERNWGGRGGDGGRDIEGDILRIGGIDLEFDDDQARTSTAIINGSA